MIRIFLPTTLEMGNGDFIVIWAASVWKLLWLLAEEITDYE